MTDKIKVVYSWIGPNGPLWNTELPNILGLGEVAEGSSNINSTFFMGESTWQELFSKCQSEYELSSAFQIEGNSDDIFVYPFTLSWRIPVSMYFCGKTGLLEFSHTPSKIIDLVKNKNGFFLIDNGVEAFLDDNILDSMYSYFEGIHGIPMHKIIWLTGAANAKQIHLKYLRNRDRSPKQGLWQTQEDDTKDCLTLKTYLGSAYIFDRYLKDEPNYNTDFIPEKLFLMWNRRYRDHRLEIALILEDLNLIDRSYVSFYKENLESLGITFQREVREKNLCGSLGISQEVAERFQNKLPLILDGENDIAVMCQDNDNRNRHYYQNSLISLVTETNFEQEQVSLTEKSFKPIKEKHPFIIVGGFNVLRYLRELGFKTFSDFWSEDYDNEIDPGTRRDKIRSTLTEISKWNHDDILRFRKNVEPILKHNYEVMKEINIENFLKELSEVIKNKI